MNVKRLRPTDIDGDRGGGGGGSGRGGGEDLNNAWCWNRA